jgi:hypothetical protein
MAFNNHGSAHFIDINLSGVLNNHGEVLTQKFIADVVNNPGEFTVYSNGVMRVDIFRLMPSGTLKINGLTINGDADLEPELIEYLTKNGGKISLTEECIVFSGYFTVNTVEARSKFPGLFSKYEFEPKWMANGVSSISAKTAIKKYWSYYSISDKYSLQQATTDVFKGRLVQSQVGCELIPKVKFDVFDKAVVARAIDRDKECQQIHEGTFHDHNLLAYLYKLLVTKDDKEVVSKIKQLLPPPPDNSYSAAVSKWLFSLPQMFFSAQPNNKQLGVHTYPVVVPTNIPRADLIVALEEVLHTVAKDDFKIAAEIKAWILKQFAAVNNKFSSIEIDDQILPTIDQLIESLKLNVIVTKEYLVELQQEEALAKEKEALEEVEELEEVEANNSSRKTLAYK